VADHDVSAIQASIKQHIIDAVGQTNWNIMDGAPRGYHPPQINIWWSGLVVGAPMEIQEIPYQWTVRVTADAGSDPERQDLVAQVWELIFDEWKDYDAISCGGNAQLAYPSRVEPFQVDVEGMLYVGIDITFVVNVKKARVFA
jgi:hypothetical protein